VSLAAANRTIEAFLDAMREAQAMANCGQVGDDLDYLLRHAKELLDVMDEELLEVDSAGQRDLFTSAAILHEKFERLRGELRGGRAH
jgi:hypothetical protein